MPPHPQQFNQHPQQPVNVNVGVGVGVGVNVAGGRGGQHGWNPAYPGAGNPYAQQQQHAPPQQYYQQGGHVPPGRGGPSRGGRGGRGGGGRGIPYAIPAPRVKKALSITDKKGIPLDFSSSKPKKSGATSTTPAAPAAAKPGTASAKPGTDAGAKLRQAALDAIQGKTDKEAASKKKAEEAAAKKKEEDEAAAKKKKDEDEAAAKKKADDEAAAKKKEEEAAEAAAAKKKEEDEQTAREAEEKKKSAAAGASKPRSSLASLLSKQKKSEEETTPAAVATPAPAPAAAETTEAPETVSSSNGKKRRHVYSKQEMLRLRSLPVCQARPADLPEFVIAKGPQAVRGGAAGGGGGGGDNHHRGDRRQQNRGGNWERGSAPPPRRNSQHNNNNNGGNNHHNHHHNNNQNDHNGGGQWARGKAPPPQQNRGGRGGGRGGRGGRGGQQGPPYFDGPVAPLVKSGNGWRPVKNTGAMVVATKLVKSILNKMTKEKFDRLSQQIIDIPVKSYAILTMMISNVYEKAIDEPYLGDMYGDLCVRLSQNVQSNSFIHIIESDEEPPTEDGEPAPPSTGGDTASNFSVFRWSNDVSTDDADIVGPFDSISDCTKMALSSNEQQDPVARGEMELELVKLQIKSGVFIKTMKLKKKEEAEENKDADDQQDATTKDQFYTVYFPASDHDQCGQQFSKIFLSERESVSDANKQNSFKRSLLNKCEDEFNKQDIYEDWKKEEAEYKKNKSSMSAKDIAEKDEDLNFRRMKIKKQMLGNIKFIGQLYKKNLLKEKIMRFCIASLLNLQTKDVKSKLPVYYDTGNDDMDEEDHEAICNMFTTIGQTIDRPSTEGFMKVCFAKILKLSNAKTLPARSRFMYKDLLDLRSNNWVPRRKEEKAKTIAEIRKDVEREERQQAQENAAANQGSYRGNNNYGGGRGGGRGGDYRNNNRSSNYGNNNNRPRQPRPAVETDDDGFTTIVGGAKQIRGGSSAAPGSTQKTPKSTPSKSGPPAAAASSAHPSLDKDKFARRVKSIRSEYIQDPKNMQELLLSMDELTGTKDYGSQFVSLNADTMFECKQDERTAIYRLLETVVKEQKISSSDVKTGLVDSIEFIDSLVCDAPFAFDYLGQMLATMIRCNAIDVTWIGQEAEKTKIGGAANPEKIVRALMKAIKADKGIEGIKNSFKPHQNAMEKLLGAAKWDSIKKENS